MLLGKGYFPQELPPPFTTKHFASAILTLEPALDAASGTSFSRFEPFSMARAGYRRRGLAITNPIHQYKLAKAVVDNWTKIRNHIVTSKLSITKPKFSSNSNRAVSYIRFRDLPEVRAAAIGHRRSILKSDASRFYHTIYTHTLAWALDGKDIAKANSLKSRKSRVHLVGDDLDAAVRNTQDRQTIGIPLGPDTSLILAELIGAAVDNEVLANTKVQSGFRFIDDYFLCFGDTPSAERALSCLNGALASYQLNINNSKTDVLKSGDFHEPTWVHDITRIELTGSPAAQKRNIQHLFDTALKFSATFHDDSVLKFSIICSTAFDIHQQNFALYVAYLLRCAIAQPNCMDAVVNTLFSYRTEKAFVADSEILSEFIEDIVCVHTPLQHHSEVAWALWMAKVLGIPLSAKAADAVGAINSSVCALIALDLDKSGLMAGALNTSAWQAAMKAPSLYSELWLMAYEAARKGWLKPASPYISKDAHFSILEAHNIFFYDEGATADNFFEKRKSKKKKKKVIAHAQPNVLDGYFEQFEFDEIELEFDEADLDDDWY